MASARSLERWTLNFTQPISKSTAKQNLNQQLNFSRIPNSRRCAILISTLPFLSLTLLPRTSEARERRNRKNIPLEDYLTGTDGLKYYDVVEGKGPLAEKGSTVEVHFDCMFRGITAISSRESKLLAGNRSIAQPYVFKVGAPPGKERKREFVDNPNGLFSAQASPKPPAALYKVTEGMRVGGKPGASFELNIELLQVMSPEEK
ncbi:peptidyl-prolyl cis-trans isomerase FKBP18, chloroplastic isoform X2 [Euphorbia lathyris]|uniref:peptidyl-prolyl cis-trans isomerase FKBP18, chloroplastic isoform X2 n=1 Tax=Euphorbia lathyris TaxID=212925 RepID=UPI003313EA26